MLVYGSWYRLHGTESNQKLPEKQLLYTIKRKCSNTVLFYTINVLFYSFILKNVNCL